MRKKNNLQVLNEYYANHKNHIKNKFTIKA